MTTTLPVWGLWLMLASSLIGSVLLARELAARGWGTA